MINDLLATPPKAYIDQAAHAAGDAIESTQRLAHDTLDRIADGVQDVRDEVAPLLSRASEQTSALSHRTLDAVLDTAHGLGDSAHRASERTVGYIRHEPVKSMLIAAATGAALMVLVGLLSRSPHRA